MIVYSGEIASYFEEVFLWDWNVGRPLKTQPSPSAKLVINEVELNPPGSDSGNEWVEIYNPNDFAIDLSGWVIENSKTQRIELSGSIKAYGFHVQTFSSQWLRNEDEKIRLLTPDGHVVDETPTLADEDNDEKTWQRIMDGYDTDSSSDWVFKPSTKGFSNAETTSLPTSSGNMPPIKIDRKLLIAILVIVVLIAVLLVYLWVRRR